MSYAEQWIALAARIRSLQTAGELFARFQSYQQEDTYGAGNYLSEQSGSVVNSLQLYRQQFAGSLPTQAVGSLDRFLDSRPARAATAAGGTQGRRAARWLR
jgi:hypothetical protein